MADDDRNDHLLMVMAAQEAGIAADFTFVDDGSRLMFHLAEVTTASELPDLIILDLRMPGLDGHRTLEELKAHPVLWAIPVVVFTSSTRRDDEVRSVNGGARWFETKPSEFRALVDFARTLDARAAERPVTLDGIEADERLSLLAADVIAEIEDDLVRAFPDWT